MINIYEDRFKDITDEHLRMICSVVLGIHPDSTHENTFVGAIILKLKEWKCNIFIHEIGMVTLTVINYPKEFEVKHYTLKIAFLQMAIALGKVNPESLVPIMVENAPKPIVE